jgi:hypothetical protein
MRTRMYGVVAGESGRPLPLCRLAVFNPSQSNILVAHRRRSGKHVPIRRSAPSLAVLDTGSRPLSIGARPSIGCLQRARSGWQLFHCIHCGSPSALVHSARRGQIARLCKHHSACHQHGGSNCNKVFLVHHSPNVPLLVSTPLASETSCIGCYEHDLHIAQCEIDSFYDGYNVAGFNLLLLLFQRRTQVRWAFRSREDL